MDIDRTDPDPPARGYRRRRPSEGNLALVALLVIPVGFAIALAVLVGGLLGVLALLGLDPFRH